MRDKIRDGDPVIHIIARRQGLVLEVFDQNGVDVAEVLWDLPDMAQFIRTSELELDRSRLKGG